LPLRLGVRALDTLVVVWQRMAFTISGCMGGGTRGLLTEARLDAREIFTRARRASYAPARHRALAAEIMNVAALRDAPPTISLSRRRPR